MRKSKAYIGFIIACIVLCSCSSPKTQSIPAPQIRFLSATKDVKLEVLDWGGTGKPILFLTGLGNTAHIYENFAPVFTDKYHVYALTRRGFGASTHPAKGYDTKTLAQDILAIIDDLGLSKVILIGHSIAGDEITKFASSYPNRVEKVVYLDAAYDHAYLFTALTDFPELPKPTAKDSASIQNLKKFTEREIGGSIPQSEVTQSSIFSKEGKYIGDVTPSSIPQAVVMNAEHPMYTRIKCPALAIYAKMSAKQFIPFYQELDSVNRKKGDKLFDAFNKISLKEEDRFDKEVSDGSIKEIKGARHYVFVSHPAETEKMVREFLQ